MSLVPTYVAATDGLFYKNPVIEGIYEDLLYFICFDDTDPPELVIEAKISYNEQLTELAKAILSHERIPFGLQMSRDGKSHRMFRGKFRPAYAIFFELIGPIPPPKGMIGVDQPVGECCIEGMPCLTQPAKPSLSSGKLNQSSSSLSGSQLPSV